MGDFNWITSKFLAFASPQFEPVAPIPRDSTEYKALPSNIPDILASDLPLPFKNVLAHFSSRRVGLVVRLNSELYSPSYFTALGISHVDMIFEDGTCPSLPLVRQFIGMAREVIGVKNRAIAVHCKAGLGRTGCLIGAYLIYRYGFTATEIISFMRFMRPGMVVGPQQHWLHLNQGSFRQWWFEDTLREKLALSSSGPSTPGRTSAHASPSKRRAMKAMAVTTPPNNGYHNMNRAALGEINHNEGTGPQQGEPDRLPAPTPGQPRKSHRKESSYPHYYSRTSGDSAMDAAADNNGINNKDACSESEEESQLRALAKPRSPARASPGMRSVSYCATASYKLAGEVMDSEQQWIETAYAAKTPKTPASTGTKSVSGPISVSKVRTGPRRVTDGTRSESSSRGAIRKLSSRIGSAGSPTRMK